VLLLQRQVQWLELEVRALPPADLGVWRLDRASLHSLSAIAVTRCGRGRAAAECDAMRERAQARQ
jgi:hypothetical protein